MGVWAKRLPYFHTSTLPHSHTPSLPLAFKSSLRVVRYTEKNSFFWEGKKTMRRSTQQRAGGMLVLISLTVGMTLIWRVQGSGFRVQSSGMRFHQPNFSTQARLSEAYGKIPLHFEANKGQTDSDVKFLARGSGYSLFLTANEAVLSLSPQRTQRAQKDNSKSCSASSAPSAVNLRMKLVGANPQPQVAGQQELPGKVNYFIGNDPKQWRTNVATYGKVKYEEVYDGIDLVYYGNQQQLEYDFVVAPGADPKDIALEFDVGADLRVCPTDAGNHRGLPLRIGADGDLVLRVGDRGLRFNKPFAYQEVNGERREVASRYVLLSNDQDHVSRFSPKLRFGFHVGSYDNTQPLIIDPILAYSTYFGGSQFDTIFGIAVDNSGNAYITGETDTASLAGRQGLRIGPAHSQSCNNCSDAFVAKLNASGTVLDYLTILGGSNDDSNGQSIAVDSAGNAYVTGLTRASDFPTPNGFQVGGTRFRNKAFVAKLNASGSALLYATILSGSQDSFQSDIGRDIAADDAGNAYVTGGTSSPDFPTKNALQPNIGGSGDSFLAKIDTTSAGASSLVYSTFLGASALGVAVDTSGNVYVGGATFLATIFGVTPTRLGAGGSSDVFVAKLNSTGSALLYATAIGGSGADSGFDMTIDSSGNAYLTGETVSTNFPTTAGAAQTAFGGGFSDAFVVKLNAAGNAFVYSTYLGGSGGDQGFGIGVDGSQNAIVTGSPAGSATLAGTAPTRFGVGGGPDVFVAKLNVSGTALTDLTILGSSDADIVTDIAVDSAGGTYVTGDTSGTNFPLASALQSSLSGPDDAFIAKIQFEINRRLAFTVQPGNAKVNQPLPAVRVSVLDANGDVDTSANDAIVLGLGNNTSGATLMRTLTVNAVNGVATFDNLSVDKAGRGYVLTAASANATSAISNPFNVGRGLAFTVQPSNTGVGQAIDPAVQVTIVDENGNKDANASDAVTVALLNNAAGGTLSGTATVNAVNGVATFSDLSLDKEGRGYTLVATASGFAQATSKKFKIGNPPFVVNSTGDDPDKDTSDGTADTGKEVDGQPEATLRAAIQQANKDGKPAKIEFKIPGGGVKTIKPQTFLPPIQVSVVIDGYTQPGARPNSLADGNDAVLLIELDGTMITGNGVGLHLLRGDNTVRGLVINKWPRAGIELPRENNRIEGNFIGTDASGTVARSNETGVLVNASSNNIIGGTTPAARNVISGNKTGIDVSGDNNFVQGNFIGTDATGTKLVTINGVEVLGNETGVKISGNNNTVGGTQAAERNVISGNSIGVLIDTGFDDRTKDRLNNVVQGNFIGTNATGGGSLGNDKGVQIGFQARFEVRKAVGNTIGGTTPSARNVISGNSVGIQIFGEPFDPLVNPNPDDNVVQGNFIVGNSEAGIEIDLAQGNTIGGSTRAAANVISGNGFDPALSPSGETANVVISAGSFNVVENNFIGTQEDGINPMSGNGRHGVLIPDGSHNIIRSNVIAFHLNGITILGTGDPAVDALLGNRFNLIRSNAIFFNTGMGIDLSGKVGDPLNRNFGGDGFTLNDAEDLDVGPNNLQNHPQLRSAAVEGSNVQIEGTLSTNRHIVPAAYIIEFFANVSGGIAQGERRIDETLVFIGASGSEDFTLSIPLSRAPVGSFITATATDPDGNTSEFSNEIQVGSRPRLSGPKVDPERLPSRGGFVEFSVFVTDESSDVTSVQAEVTQPDKSKVMVNLFLDSGTPREGRWWSDDFRIPPNTKQASRTYVINFIATNALGGTGRTSNLQEIFLRVDGKRAEAKGGNTGRMGRGSKGKGKGKQQVVPNFSKNSDGRKKSAVSSDKLAVTSQQSSVTNQRLNHPTTQPPNHLTTILPTLSGEDWTAVIDPMNDLLMLTLRQTAGKDSSPYDNAANRVILLTPTEDGRRNTQHAIRNTQYVMFVGKDTQEVWAWNEQAGTFTDVTDWVWWDDDGQQMMVVLPWSSVGFVMEFEIQLRR